MRKPNFLFILIDDMGWKDLGCYGSGFYETPNLDRLCGEGVSFTDAYAACPVCSPTRASVLTGKYPARLGITTWINWRGGGDKGKLLSAPYVNHLPLEERTIARLLKDAGYRTYHVGKWHLGTQPYWPEHHGFDVNVGGCEWGMPLHGYFSPWRIPGLADGPPGSYLTDHLTDAAIALIEDNGDAPFFLHLPYYSVHIPIQVQQAYVDKYEAKARDLGLDRVKALEEGEAFPVEHKKHLRVVRRLLQSDPVYAGMVERLDHNIGRVLEALARTGQAQDTVVIFTSDNGGLATAEGSPTSNAPLSEGKGWMYEGGTREPLIVRWPGVVAPGSRCAAPVTSTDFYPTMLEMAGLDPLPEQHCDGLSLVPLLTGAGPLDREAIFWHYPHYGNQGGTPGSSVRAGDYKLIEFFEDGSLELYNLREDIGEADNLLQELPQLAAHLKGVLSDWRQRVAARIPEPNPEYEP